MRQLVVATLIATLASACAAAPALAGPTPGPETTQKVFDEIAAKDAELFAAAFDRCDIDRLNQLVTDDVEFIHDKWGQTSRTRAEFVGGFAKTCERQKTGEDYRARRELVPGSMTVHMINNYGAMQMGEHRFFRLEPGKPEELVETARFIDIWKNVDGQWKLFRVISYDHRLTK